MTMLAFIATYEKGKKRKVSSLLAYFVLGAIRKQDIEATKQDIGDTKQDIEAEKQDIQRMIDAGLSKKSAANAMKLYRKFGVKDFFGRTEVMDLVGITQSPASELLKKCGALGITEAVSGMGKGKYRFNPAFFM